MATIMISNVRKLKVLSAIFIAVVGSLLTILLSTAAVQSDVPSAVPLIVLTYLAGIFFLHKDAVKVDKISASTQ